MRTMNNYYETLNVSESANADDIKRAYRKMAMDLHPDRGGDPERFKAVSVAYETLSDPQRRQEYDFQRQNPFANQQQGFHNQNFHFNFGPGGINIDEIFSQFHGGSPFGRRQAKNRDIQIAIAVDFKSTLNTQNRVINIQSPTGNEAHHIEIPRGIENGATMRFPGQGDNSTPGIPRGDLLVIIQYEQHPNFQLTPNYCLMTKVRIPAFDAILGGKAQVKTVADTTVEISIPPGTAVGTVFKVRGHGLYMPNSNVRADMLVEVEVDIPVINDPISIARLREIANAFK